MGFAFFAPNVIEGNVNQVFGCPGLKDKSETATQLLTYRPTNDFEGTILLPNMLVAFRDFDRARLHLESYMKK